MSDIDDIIALLNTPTHAPPDPKENRVQEFEHRSYPHTLYHASNVDHKEGDTIIPWQQMTKEQRAVTGKENSSGDSFGAWASTTPGYAESFGKKLYTVRAPHDANVLSDGRVWSHGGFKVQKRVF